MDVIVTVTSSSMSDTHGVGQRSSSARTHTSMHSSKYSDAAGSRGGGTRGNLHSSSLLASSSKLKAPTRVDQEKMLHKCLTSNASTGGNGIRRPYGRFIASRGGVALSVWERMAPPLGRAASAELPSVPPSPPDRSLGRNVSKYNVQRRAYTSRSMDTSSKAVKSIYSFEGLDSINFSSSSVAEMPIFSRPRPELSGVTLSTSASDKPASVGSGSYRTNGRAASEDVAGAPYRFPSATFLTRIPSLPPAIRVDCGQVSAKEFLRRQEERAPSAPIGTKKSRIVRGGHGEIRGEIRRVHEPIHNASEGVSLGSFSSFGLPEVLNSALSIADSR